MINSHLSEARCWVFTYEIYSISKKKWVNRLLAPLFFLHSKLGMRAYLSSVGTTKIAAYTPSFKQHASGVRLPRFPKKEAKEWAEQVSCGNSSPEVYVLITGRTEVVYTFFRDAPKERVEIGRYGERKVNPMYLQKLSTASW